MRDICGGVLPTIRFPGGTPIVRAREHIKLYSIELEIEMKPQTLDFFAGRNIPLFLAWSVALFFATLGFIGIDPPVQAVGNMPQIGLQPAYPDPGNPVGQSYFIFKSNPGAFIQNAVRVVNSGTVAGNATLYSADAITGVTSGAVYQDQAVRSQDVGRWLTLDRHTLTLFPGESTIVPFEATLPKKFVLVYTWVVSSWK